MVSGERERLVVIAAATGAAASAAVSTAVTPSCKLVWGGVPSVSAVTAVRSALVVGDAGVNERLPPPRGRSVEMRPRPRPGPEEEVEVAGPTCPLVPGDSAGGWEVGFSSIFSISLTATLA